MRRLFIGREIAGSAALPDCLETGFQLLDLPDQRVDPLGLVKELGVLFLNVFLKVGDAFLQSFDVFHGLFVK